VVDGGGAEEAGAGGPYVEAAPGVEDVVDEGECVFLGGDFVGVPDDFCIWVLCVYGVGELGVWFGGEVRTRVYACCAVGCSSCQYTPITPCYFFMKIDGKRD
jgi:hypothetical protein